MVSTKEIPTDDELDLIIELAKKSSYNEYVIYTLLRKTGRRLGELIGVETFKKRCSVCRWEGMVGKEKMVCPKCKEIKGKEYKERNLKESGPIIWNLGMQVNDFDANDNSVLLYVIKKKTYKKEKNYLDKDTVKLLSEFIEKNKLKYDSFMFRGKHFPSYRTIERHFKEYYNTAWKKYLKQKGMMKKNITVHSIRHWVVTSLRKKGKSYDDISRFFTRQTVGVMQKTYDHLMIEDKKEDVIDIVNEL